MAQNIGDSGHCHFLDLPAELRLIIYETVLPPREVQVEVVDAAPKHVPPSIAIATEPHIAIPDMGLLSACKTTHAETTPLSYGSLTLKLVINAWECESTHVSLLGAHHYLVRGHEVGRLSFRRLWPIGSFGPFNRIRRAKISMTLSDAYGGQNHEQVSVPTKLQEVVRCLNAAPKLKAVDLHNSLQAEMCLAAHTAAMAAVSRLRHGLEVRATMDPLDSSKPGHHEALQMNHRALEAIGGVDVPRKELSEAEREAKRAWLEDVE